MDRVKVDLENCYGIKKLQHNFDFKKEKVYAIYAPNGVMKTSFAQAFQGGASHRSRWLQIPLTRP